MTTYRIKTETRGPEWVAPFVARVWRNATVTGLGCSRTSMAEAVKSAVAEHRFRERARREYRAKHQISDGSPMPWEVMP